MGNFCPTASFDTDDFLISQEYDIMTVTRHMFRIMYIVLYLVSVSCNIYFEQTVKLKKKLTYVS